MTGVYGSDTSLPSFDPEQSHFASHKTAPQKREIVIRIYASDDNAKFSDGRIFATAPVPPPTPPDTTAEEKSSGSEREKKKHGKSRSTPRRKLSKSSRSRGADKSSLKRSISNPMKQLHHATNTETFRQARGITPHAAPETPHRASQPTQRVQWQGSRSQESLKRNEQPSKGNHGQEAKYEFDLLNKGDAPVFGSCEKRVRRNRSYESNIVPPSKRGRSRTLDQPAIDDVEPSRSATETPLSTHDGKMHRHARNAPEPSPSLSLEQFRKAIGWPSVVDCPNTVDLAGPQRHSGTSTASTVEAMIVDDSAQSPKRGLRHTEKRPSLRFASSPVTNPERASPTSGFDSPHRLLHKSACISEKDRRNIAPEIEMAVGPASQAPKRRVDVVPVVVIPERHSSLNSSTPAKGPPRPSQQSSRRPATAAGDGTRPSGCHGNFVAGPPQGIATRSQSVRRPAVPPRRSSLSAPTSANNSRATSLTSDSLRSHTLATKQADFKKHIAEKPMPDLPPEARRPNLYGLSEEAMKTQSILIGIEDVDSIGTDNIGTPSMPISLGSQPSSPGVVEVNEATAVSLFPHNNESLLLVDQQMRNKQEAQNKSQAPQGDSPLENIRLPPNTPTYHVTPPSPMKELEQKQANSNTQEPTLRRFGSLRRAWTVRTRTEPQNVPKRSFSTSATLRKATNREPENRLHPFWRPRRPGNVSLGSAGRTSPNHTPTSNTKQNDNIVNNSLGMPQPRAVMNGPSFPARTRSRRETNERQRPQPPTPRDRGSTTVYNPALNRSTIALGSTTTNRVLNGSEFMDRKTRASRQLRQHSVSWGYRVRFAAVRNLRRRFRGRMEQREEGKHEARREKLKRDIIKVQVDSAHGYGRGRGKRLAKKRM